MKPLVDFEMKGYRDVHWCYILNEPWVIQYRDGHAYCTNCTWLDDGEKGQLTEVFLGHHPFICHIYKPRTSDEPTVEALSYNPAPTHPADLPERIGTEFRMTA